jgi:hypothetical protein
MLVSTSSNADRWPLATNNNSIRLHELSAVLPVLPEKEAKLRAKDSAQWECIKCARDDEFGGEIYTFRLNPIYDSSNSEYSIEELEKITKQIFPAEEPNLDKCNLIFGTDESYKEVLRRSLVILFVELLFGPMRLHVEEFYSLGYSFENDKNGTYLQLPNREALLARWQKLKAGSDLPDLSIESSEGISDDLSFVKAYLKHDALLSTGKEFVHDHMTHILPTITRILTEKSAYQDKKAEMVEMIKRNLRKIEIVKDLLKQNKVNIEKDELRKLKKYFPVMETFLGSFVDTLTASSFFYSYSISLHLYQFMGSVIPAPFQYDYFTGRHPNLLEEFRKEFVKTPESKNLKISEREMYFSGYCKASFPLLLKELWNLITKIAEEFDNQQQSAK